MSIAERESDPVSGREAAYLCAVALRHSARRVDDLSPVITFLDKAEEAWEKDVANRPELSSGTYRFRAERFALFVSYHLFRLMLGRPIPETIPDLKEIQEGIDSELKRLAELTDNSDEIGYAERCLLVNWCVAALLRYKETGEADFIRAAAPYSVALEKNIIEEKIKNLCPSYYVEVIHRVVLLLLIIDRKEQNVAKQEVLQWLLPEKIKQHSVTRYDTIFFEFLRELSEYGLASSSSSFARRSLI